MNMTKEDYVSSEVAKLLKEKGFNWMESPFYSEQDIDEWQQNNRYTVPNEEYNPEIPFDSETLTLVAPHVSLQMAMKWLREVHNIHIEIYVPDKFADEPCYKAMIWDRNTEIGTPLPYDVSYTCFETCAEASIKYCLENLI